MISIDACPASDSEPEPDCELYQFDTGGFEKYQSESSGPSTAVVETNPASDSESDCDLPKFDLPAFKKYQSESCGPSTTVIKSAHGIRITINSALNAGKEYNKNHYISTNVSKNSLTEVPLEQKKHMEKVLSENMKKSICQPGFEKLEKLPTLKSRMQLRKLAAKEREKTTGENWFNMPAPEMTDEKKNDLLVLQMRQALDPKRFYKRSAKASNPKYFQVGTYVEAPVDFYCSRIPKKQRKQTLVEELLADAEFRQYQKKKFLEIQQALPPKYFHRKRPTHKQRVAARHVETSKSNKKSKKGKKK